MSKTFSQLKNSKLQFEQLQESLKKADTTKKDYTDARMWKPTVDKSGTGSAEIRFLPAGPSTDKTFIRIHEHQFQGPGGQWYWKNCPTTIDGECPVCQANSNLWNSGFDADKEIARKRKRKTHYISNIYVVRDPGNPENEGKVFLYKYGKSIFDKLSKAMNPQFEDEVAFNPFDMFSGANFKLRIATKDKYLNYDDSKFGNNGPLLDSEDEMEKVWNAEYDLDEFLKPENFEPYDKLKERFEKVIKGKVSTETAEDTTLSDDDYNEILNAQQSRPEPPTHAYESEAEKAPVIDADDLADISDLLNGLD